MYDFVLTLVFLSCVNQVISESKESSLRNTDDLLVQKFANHSIDVIMFDRNNIKLVAAKSGRSERTPMSHEYN